MAIAGGGWWTRIGFMSLSACDGCSGIDSRSEGVVDALGVHDERGELAAHARQCFWSAGVPASQNGCTDGS